MNNDRIRAFTDLKVWQEAHTLAVLVYEMTEKLPAKETYALGDQMRRATSSVTSNIAEGFGRRSFKEKIQFYYLAQGSLSELKSQIFLAKDVSYIGGESFKNLMDQSDTAHRLLRGLITKSKIFLNRTS